jgi:hypothetical protein
MHALGRDCGPARPGAGHLRQGLVRVALGGGKCAPG